MPNNSFKPKPLRYTKGMAGKACHGFGSTTRFGLTQALGRTTNMPKIPLAKAERLYRAFVSGIAILALQLLAYKLGYRGKYHPADTFTSWSDVVAHLPSSAVLAILLAWCVYFWLGRRDS